MAFVQSSKILGKTATSQDKNIDFLVRDITNIYEELQSSNELQEVLSNGNSTGTNDILIDTGQYISFNNGGFEAKFVEPTLTGDVTITSPSTTGTLALVSDIPVVGYLVYKAFLNQAGTSAPTATIFENTIGDIIWTRDGIGEYTGTLAGAFTTNKTIVKPPTNWGGSFGGTQFEFLNSMFTDNANTVQINTKQTNGLGGALALSDNDLYVGYSYIEIIVRP